LQNDPFHFAAISAQASCRDDSRFRIKRKAVIRTPYVCDPVLVIFQPSLRPEHVAAIVRDRLLPMADIATPNPFELGWLTGHAIDSIAEVEAARRSLSISPTAQLIVTGCSLADTLQNHIESVLIGPRGTSRHPVLHIPSTLPGTGDLFAGLIVAGLGCGMDLPKAVDLAQEMTSLALGHAKTLNAGEVTLDDSQFRHALLTLTKSRFDQHAGIQRLPPVQQGRVAPRSPLKKSWTS